MSFIEQAYLEIKTIDPSITATEFSTKWLNKCSSYYRSCKARNRDMTLHALMCFLVNLSKKADALRMNNNNALLQKRADQYQALRELASEQVTLRISTRWTKTSVDIIWCWLYFFIHEDVSTWSAKEAPSRTTAWNLASQKPQKLKSTLGVS